MEEGAQKELDPLVGSFKIVNESSQTLITWSLSILGGSIATILGSSYLRPDALTLRLPYLLFVPGWIFLVYSIAKGHEVSRRYIAALFVHGRESCVEIGSAINEAYRKQIALFRTALTVFAAWLVFFILWWVITGGMPPAVS